MRRKPPHGGIQPAGNECRKSISEEKRERIRAVIERTGYRPNPAAQTMRTGRCDEIGVIVPKIDSDSVSAIVAGISEGLKDKNYMVVLGSTAGVREEEIRYLSAMQSSNVAGIILMGTVMTPFRKAGGCNRTEF